MEEIVPVKVQPLLAGAFKPYGTVIEGEDLGYPATEEGRVGIEKLRLRFRPGANRVEQLAIHFSYNQAFIPLTARWGNIALSPSWGNSSSATLISCRQTMSAPACLASLVTWPRRRRTELIFHVTILSAIARTPTSCRMMIDRPRSEAGRLYRVAPPNF